jgi:hypothetical protein
MNEPTAATLGPDARQKTIDVLCESFAQDEMDVEEFEQRVALVERAVNTEQLRAILADLPSAKLQGPGASPYPAATTPRASTTALQRRPTLPPEQISEHSVTVGILGGGGRAGAWVPARTNWAVSVLGGCHVDLREAQLGSGVTEVRVLGVLGGVHVLVSPDVRVECSGVGILGGFDHKGASESIPPPDAPVIRVTGLAVLGGVSVTVRLPGETVRDARRRRKAERKARRQIGPG